jgi:membrane protein implicated in regulation of membrane protease activity
MLENIPLKYLWILLGLAIMSMELFLPGFILVFFGLGAVLTGLLLVFIPMSINTQLVLFTVLSIVFLFVFRRMAQGYFVGRVANTNPTGAAMEVFSGETAVVTEDIIPNTPQGKVEFHGSFWNADAETEIKKGIKVNVLERRDLTLKVKPLA